MRALALALAASLASCASLDAFLYNPTVVDRYDLSYDASVPASWRVPESLREAVEVRSQDGTRVYGYYLRRPAAEEATAPVVFYSHGNTRNLELYWSRAGHLWSLGANVLIYDYRGYGRTGGTPDEATIYQDARAMLAWLRTGPHAVPNDRLYLYGYSLGGGITLELASSGERVRGVVTEAAFASVAALVEDGSLLVPGSFLARNRFDNRAKIDRAAQNSALGVLLFHGTADDFVAPSHSQRLYDAIARTRARELVLVPGADHSSVSFTLAWENRMRTWLRQ